MRLEYVAEPAGISAAEVLHYRLCLIARIVIYHQDLPRDPFGKPRGREGIQRQWKALATVISAENYCDFHSTEGRHCRHPWGSLAAVAQILVCWISPATAEFVADTVSRSKRLLGVGKRLSERFSSQTIFRTLGTRRRTFTGEGLNSDISTGISSTLKPSLQSRSTMSVWNTSSVV